MTELRTFVQLTDEDDTLDELDDFGNPKKKVPTDDTAGDEDAVADEDKLDDEEDEEEDEEVVA